jgi:hypothetical protein
VNIIGYGNARSQKGIVFDDSELGHVNVVMDLDVVPYSAAIVNDGIIPDAKTVSNDIFFSDNHIVTGLQIVANSAATVDYATGPNVSIAANDEELILATGRRVTEVYAVINDRPFS